MIAILSTCAELEHKGRVTFRYKSVTYKIVGEWSRFSKENLS